MWQSFWSGGRGTGIAFFFGLMWNRDTPWTEASEDVVCLQIEDESDDPSKNVFRRIVDPSSMSVWVLAHCGRASPCFACIGGP